MYGRVYDIYSSKMFDIIIIKDGRGKIEDCCFIVFILMWSGKILFENI